MEVTEMTAGVVENTPGLVVSGQLSDPGFSNQPGMGRERPGDGGHARCTYKTRFLGKRLPLPGRCLKTKTTLPDLKGLVAGKFAKKRQEIRLSGGEVLGAHIGGSAGNPFCRKPASGATAFFEHGDVMAKALELDCSCQPRQT